MQHDCVQKKCHPPKIVGEINKWLTYEEPTLKKLSCKNIQLLLEGHEQDIYQKIIAEGNYQLFREITKYDKLVIVKQLMKEASKCRNLEPMLRANDDEPFKNSILYQHYEIGAVILNSIKDSKNNADTIGFNIKQKQLVIQDDVLKVITKLPNYPSLEFTIEDYELTKNSNDSNTSPKIQNYSISIDDSSQVEVSLASASKKFFKSKSTFSLHSIASLASSLPPIKFIIRNEVGKVKLDIFEDNCQEVFSFPLNIWDSPEGNSFAFSAWLPSCCSHLPSLMPLGGHNTEENA